MGEYYPVFLFLSERSLVLGDLRRLIMKAFGEKVRQLREERGISREAFCGDETELSIRQLYRVETGQSIQH